MDIDNAYPAGTSVCHLAVLDIDDVFIPVDPNDCDGEPVMWWLYPILDMDGLNEHIDSTDSSDCEGSVW